MYKNIEKQKIHHEKLNDIIQEFGLLNSGVTDLAKSNEMTANDTRLRFPPLHPRLAHTSPRAGHAGC